MYCQPAENQPSVETFITRKWKVSWDGSPSDFSSSSADRSEIDGVLDQLLASQQSADEQDDQLGSQMDGVSDSKTEDVQFEEQLRYRAVSTFVPHGQPTAVNQFEDGSDCPLPVDCPVPTDCPVQSDRLSSCSCPRKRKEIQEDSSLEHDRKFSRSCSVDPEQLAGFTPPRDEDYAESQPVSHPPPRKRSSRSAGARRGKRDSDQQRPVTADETPSAVAASGRGDEITSGLIAVPPSWLPASSASALSPIRSEPPAVIGDMKGEDRREGEENSCSQAPASPCWVSQQLAHMLRRGQEEEVEEGGRDRHTNHLVADRHREMNRHLFLPDRRLAEVDRNKSSSKTSRSLCRELASVRKRLEAVEQQFVQRTGYRPSQADKLQDSSLKALLAEQARLKRDIKSEKENRALASHSSLPSLLLRPLTLAEPLARPPQLVVASTEDVQSEQAYNVVSQSEGSVKNTNQSDNCAFQSEKSSRSGVQSEASLLEIESRLREIVLTMEVKRQEQGRPYDLLSMSLEQLCEEKAELQILLLDFEKQHGHPDTKQAKEAAKELYDRYRMVKRMARRSNSARSRESVSDLVTIPEGVALSLTLASPAHRLQVEVAATYAAAKNSGSCSGGGGSSNSGGLSSSRRDMDLPRFEHEGAEADKNWHALSREELQEIQRRVREEKRAARRAVKEFEEAFRSQTGRRLTREDREPLDTTYRSYKMSKSQLKLINALLSKLDRRQFEKYSRYSGRYDR